MKKYPLYFVLCNIFFATNLAFADCQDNVATCVRNYITTPGHVTIGTLFGGKKVGYCEDGYTTNCYPCELYKTNDKSGVQACHKAFPERCPDPNRKDVNHCYIESRH